MEFIKIGLLGVIVGLLLGIELKLMDLLQFLQAHIH